MRAGPSPSNCGRAEGGIRLWATQTGESYHASTVPMAAFGRRLGRPPQMLAWVGFSTQGEYRGFPYSFLDGILDPRVAFMREGMEGKAKPGGILGERGLEWAVARRAMSSIAPIPAWARRPMPSLSGGAVIEDPTYQPVNEERYDHTWPAAREDIIRSDLTFFETPTAAPCSPSAR